MDAVELEKLASLEDKHWWYAARRSLLREALRQIPPARALDVGAGAGGNTRVIKAAGWDVTALELSETGATIAKERALPTVRADATSLPFSDLTFDLVVSMDLWEHIPDDEAAAQETARVLKPGGRLYLVVPCDMSLWSGHDVAVGHVRRYERDQLTRMVQRAGFGIISTASWNVLLRPVVKFRRGNSSECSSDLTPLPRPVNGVLRAVVEVERRLPLSRRRGVSLIVEAQKR